MNFSNKLALSSCIISLGLCGNVLANGMMPDADCCTEIEKRVKRLEDKAVESDDKKIYISGHVNRAMLWADNGVNSSVQHVDNGNWSSRLQVAGDAAFNDDLSFGGTFIVEMQPNSTFFNDVKDAQANTIAENEINVRVAEVHAASRSYGTLSLGHGYMASYGVQYFTDLTTAFNFTMPWTTVGAIQFTNKATRAKTGPVINPLYVMFMGDGASMSGRQDRIRYDSPKYYGFSIATSHGYAGSGDIWDAALKFAGKFGGWIVASQVAFARNNSRQSVTTGGVTFGLDTGQPNIDFDNISGSIGVLAPFSFTGREGSGIVGYFGFGHRDYEHTNYADGNAKLYRLGYRDLFFDIGQSIITGSIGATKNMVLFPGNSDIKVIGKSWGIGVQQNIDKVGTEVYARYENVRLKLRNSGSVFNDIDAVLVGARVKL